LRSSPSAGVIALEARGNGRKCRPQQVPTAWSSAFNPMPGWTQEVSITSVEKRGGIRARRLLHSPHNQNANTCGYPEGQSVLGSCFTHLERC